MLKMVILKTSWKQWETSKYKVSTLISRNYKVSTLISRNTVNVFIMV